MLVSGWSRIARLKIHPWRLHPPSNNACLLPLPQRPDRVRHDSRVRRPLADHRSSAQSHGRPPRPDPGWAAQRRSATVPGELFLRTTSSGFASRAAVHDRGRFRLVANSLRPNRSLAAPPVRNDGRSWLRPCASNLKANMFVTFSCYCIKFRSIGSDSETLSWQGFV